MSSRVASPPAGATGTTRLRADEFHFVGTARFVGIFQLESDCYTPTSRALGARMERAPVVKLGQGLVDGRAGVFPRRTISVVVQSCWYENKFCKHLSPEERASLSEKRSQECDHERKLDTNNRHRTRILAEGYKIRGLGMGGFQGRALVLRRGAIASLHPPRFAH